MPGKLADSIGKHAVLLGGFALLAALLLGAVNLVTADRIREQQLMAERRALAEVLPARFHDNDLLADSLDLAPGTSTFDQPGLLGLTIPRRAYIGRTGGELSAIILPAEAHDGYSGDILLLVGILADGSLSGVRVLEHRETPGLGDKIELDVSRWILGFDGKSLDEPPESRWQVINDGGDFDQLAGATITPRAVVNAIRKSLQFYELNRDILAEQ